MSFKIFLFAILLILFGPISIASTPAAPIWHSVTLSDGYEVKVILRGDSRFHWYEDIEGNALTKKDKRWFYSQIKIENNEPILISTGIEKTIKNKGPESSKERPKGLAKKSFLLEISKFKRGNKIKNNIPTKMSFMLKEKTQPLLVVQVSFTDEVMVHDFKSLIFESKEKSVVDYYYKNSNRKFNIIPSDENYGVKNDGVINVFINDNHPNCHVINSGDTCDLKMNLVFKSIYREIESYVNFSKFDLNENGEIEPEELSVIFIFAGGDRSTGYIDRPAIWPHKFSHDSIIVDGKVIKEYCVFADFQIKHQSTLGVIVHELGHLMLNLPDLYSYRNSASIGNWGVMGSGMWGMKNDDSYAGETPVNMNAWTKHAAGFIVPDIVDAGSSYQEIDKDEVKLVYLDPYLKEHGPRIYLENRVSSGYDASLPASGVLATSFSNLSDDSISRMMQVQVMQSDGGRGLEFGLPSNKNDLYPYGGNIISDDSKPSIFNITGYRSNIEISNINWNSYLSSFDVFNSSHDSNKYSLFNYFYKSDNSKEFGSVIAVSLEINIESLLDGFQIDIKKDKINDSIDYELWLFPYPESDHFKLMLNKEEGVLIQKGTTLNTNRILFENPSKLKPGKYIALIEIIGGEFKSYFKKDLANELEYKGKVWLGDGDFHYNGLELERFYNTPFSFFLEAKKSDSNNRSPNAEVEANITEMISQGTIIISATNSFDPDGDVLEYNWEQTSGSKVILGETNNSLINFIIPENAKNGDILSFKVTVTDPEGLFSTAEIDIEVAYEINNFENGGKNSGGSLSYFILFLLFIIKKYTRDY